MTPGRRRRALPRWLVGVVLAACAAGLAACGSDGDSLARQACDHVHRSVALYHQSTATADPATARRLAEQADLQLTAAVPLAAQAANANGQWQALMTTLSESTRVPEQYLIQALTDQCAQADNANAPPPAPTNVPPPATTTPTPGTKPQIGH